MHSRITRDANGTGAPQLPNSASSGAFRFAARVVPNRYQLDDLKASQCLYGVSIGSPGKSPDLIRAGYGWTVDHFADLAVLLGDSLYRITLQIQKGLEPARASAAAIDAGAATLANILGTFVPKPTVIRCSEVMARREFADALEKILHFDATSIEFRDSVRRDAAEFVERQAKRGRLAIGMTSALDLAAHYLHEEIAVYLVLAEKGWLTDVYVGRELPTLQRISTGLIFGAPSALEKRVNVSLRAR